MHTYILLLLIWGGQRDTSSIVATEFSDKAACEAAAAAVGPVFSGWSTKAYPVCVAKQSEPAR